MSAVLDREADLELAAGLEGEPEYVVTWTPPWAYGRIRDRIFQPGFWELLTFAEYQSGVLARDDWTVDGHADCYAVLLAAWVKGLLGFPVSLEHGEMSLTAQGFFSRWNQVPLYWVRRSA